MGKRIVRLLILLFGVSILCFVLTALSSTDPATYIVRREISPTPEAIEQVRVELGLTSPCRLGISTGPSRFTWRLWRVDLFNQ
ncbi:MAG: hypothetical protein ACLUFF_04295 [Acutalibacteraceae bacterium]